MLTGKRRLEAKEKLRELVKIKNQIAKLEKEEDEIRKWFNKTLEREEEVATLTHKIMKVVRKTLSLKVDNNTIYKYIGGKSYIAASSISIPKLKTILKKDLAAFRKFTQKKEQEYVAIFENEKEE